MERIGLLVLCSAVLTFAQTPVEYENNAAEQCSYTFNVPVQNVNAQCNGPVMNRHIEEIRRDNSRITEENKQLKIKIDNITQEYGAMVETVKTLERETSTWREIVEWPVFDSPITSENISEIINLQKTYEDCYQAIRRSGGRKGIYNIQPRNAQHPHQVYCDEEGWTVVLRRLDGRINFYRNWNDFSGGFGELGGEYFAGLELIHLLTARKPYEFRSEVLGWNNKLYTSNYDDFEVADELDGYLLSVGNMSGGNVRSSFTELSGSAFTTMDRDNDDWDQNNCARHYRGGWWLKNCGFDPSRDWCNGSSCMSWGEQNAKKILLKMRPMNVKGSSFATRPAPKAKSNERESTPKRAKKATRNKKTKKTKTKTKNEA